MTDGGSADASVNNASIYVKLTDLDSAAVTQSELMQRRAQLLKKYPPEIHTGVELVNDGRRQPEQRRQSSTTFRDRICDSCRNTRTPCWRR